MNLEKRVESSVHCQLFVYGTLIVPAVMQAVTGRTFRSDPARLPGFARYQIKHQVFPGIVHSEVDSVDGVLYHAIDACSLKRLDRFESVIYHRKQVNVRLDDERIITAYAYVVAPDYTYLLSDKAWDLDDFEQQHLRAYLSGV